MSSFVFTGKLQNASSQPLFAKNLIQHSAKAKKYGTVWKILTTQNFSTSIRNPIANSNTFTGLSFILDLTFLLKACVGYFLYFYQRIPLQKL